MLKKLKYALSSALFVVALFVSTNLSATHLMGGNLAYEYLGLNASTGNFEYRVTLFIYRLCDPGSAQLPATMELGAYQDNPGNPGGDKNRIADVTMPLVSQQFIQPPNANDSCTFLPNVCVEQGVYEVVIGVPVNTSGYYFIADRCCRNNNIANLDNPGDAGQAYYASVPPPSVVNNSPTFAVAPVPFICAGDTVTVLNQAFDVDGDLLTYEFVTPYNGISAAGNPNPGPPFVYPWPIQQIAYAPGFSVTSPFGAGGFIDIDTLTGLATYLSPNQGFYVVAVEIKEFRNGVLIGVTRRDIQLIVITCPVNPAPNIIAGSPTTYTIQEGQTLCFNVAFADQNGDSLFLTRQGDIFNSLITNPAATLSNANGLGSVSSQFCWTTSCDQGRTTPYQFSAIVNDNGCPAKTTNVVYTINVIPAQQPALINGPDTLCLNAASGVGYNVTGPNGYTYQWLISQGNQAGGGNSSSITANFTSAGTATVSVIASNAFGCVADTISKNVIIRPLPAANAGTDIGFCSGGSVTLGSAPVGGVSYSWSPATGLSNPGIANPVVTLTNGGGSPQSTTYVLTTTLNGCINRDTVVVTANPLGIANAGNNVSICSGSSAPLGALPGAGNAYTWAPATGLSNTAIANPVISLTTTNTVPDTLQYTLIVENSFGCRDSDTVQVIVRPLPVSVAGNDISFCSGQSGTIGGSPVTNYTYGWSPATGLANAAGSSTGVTLTTSLTVNDTIPYVLTSTLFGCIDRDTVNVIVRPLPVAAAGPDRLICNGSTVNLGALPTTGYIYNWSPGTGLSSATASNPSLSLSLTPGDTVPDTLFYVVTTTLAGCTTRDTVRVVVSPIPDAAAGNDVSFCSGQTATLGTPPVSGYTYSWSPSGGLSNATSPQPVLLLNNNGTVNDTVPYIMTATWFGCIDRDTLLAIVRPRPVSEAGTNTSLCSGDTLQLGSAPTPGYTYSWSPSTGLNSTTSSSPQLIVSNTGGSASSQTYTVVTTLAGCTSTDSVVITTNPLPVVTASANPIAICLGSIAQLSGSGASTYSWALISNPSTSIGTGSTISVSPALSTFYIVTGTSSAGCINKDTVAVTVNPLPAVAITSPNDTICEGDTIQLSGAGAINYSWIQQGTGVIGTGNSLTVSPTTNTTYILNGTDANQCSNSDTISITVNPAPTINGITGTLSLCPGVTGVPYWANNPNPSSTYTWAVGNGTIVSGQGSDTIFVDWDTTAGPTFVSIIEVTDLGCTSEPVVLPVSINVVLTPPAPAGPGTLCANTAKGISYSSFSTPGSTYNWFAQGGTVISGNGTSNVIVDWNTAGPATVALWYEETSVTNDTTCFGISDTLFISISPVPVTSAITGDIAICIDDTGSYSVINTNGSTYQWTNSGGAVLAGNGTNSISTNWTTAGTATVSVTETNSFGCTGDPVNFSVTVNPLPNASAGSDATICFGDTTQLNAGGGISYQWSPSAGLDNATIANPLANPSSTTSYVVEVTDANGCRNSDTVTVFVNALPIVSSGGNIAICLGTPGQLNASGGVSYAWTPGTGLSDPSIANPQANPTITTTYTVIVTDANGCSASDQAQVTVNPLPVATAISDTLVCSGAGVGLNAGGGVSYQWSPTIGLSNASAANPVANPGNTTVYTVTVTDVNGCTDEEQVEVSINPQPVAAFEIDTVRLRVNCDGVRIKTINNSTDALSYIWLFGDGNTSTTEEPFYQYPFGANVNLTLIATNGQCADTLVLPQQMLNLEDYLKGLPNTFTPNDDGINDCFELRARLDFEECSTWVIFNRWGEKVYENSNPDGCWNGKRNNDGEPCPSGTYFYVLKVKEASFKGSVHLIR